MEKHRNLEKQSGSEIERMEIAQMLYRAIDGLREDEKALLIATEIEGRTFRELAERWGIPLNTLLSRKARAMKKLKVRIDPIKRFLNGAVAAALHDGIGLAIEGIAAGENHG